MSCCEIDEVRQGTDLAFHDFFMPTTELGNCLLDTVVTSLPAVQARPLLPVTPVWGLFTQAPQRRARAHKRNPDGSSRSLGNWADRACGRANGCIAMRSFLQP